MNRSYFTFGSDHIHTVDNFVYDKDIVVEIRAEDPRAEMFRIFGKDWASEYKELPDMRYFKRGVKKVRVGAYASN